MNKTAVENVEGAVKVRERNLILGFSNAVIIFLSITLHSLTELWYDMEAFKVVSVVHREIPFILLFMVTFASLVLVWVDHYLGKVNLINFWVVIPFVGWYVFEVLFGLMLQNYFFFDSFLLAFASTIIIAGLLILGLNLIIKKISSMKPENRSPIFISWTSLFTMIVLFLIFV